MEEFLLSNARIRTVIQRVADFHGRCNNIRIFDKRPQAFGDLMKEKQAALDDHEEETKVGISSKSKVQAPVEEKETFRHISFEALPERCRDLRGSERSDARLGSCGREPR